MKCNACDFTITESDRFCPNCGKPVSQEQTESTGPDSGESRKVIQSTGTYSGKMIKSKGRTLRKMFFRTLFLIIIAVIAYLVYWFKTDPKAGQKVIEVVGGIVVMGIILGLGYLFSRKRGKYADSDYFDND